MVKLLIGGSPCTYWSVAQKKNRETEAEGLGWELFKNYLIAKEKFKPDFFLYENNKSAAQPIKDQISHELGVELMYINSALVSAQSRQRFYAFNWNVEQPADRGILLKDILESGVPFRNEKSYCIDANYYKGGNMTSFNKQSGQRLQVAEPVNTATDGKARTLKAQYFKNGIANFVTNGGFSATAVAEPIHVRTLPNSKGEMKDAQATRIYSIDGKSVNLVANGEGREQKTGLYTLPVEKKVGFAIAVEWNENGEPIIAISGTDEKTYPVYKVENGFITIKDMQYQIKLADGYYIIRKLSVKECCRLQTMPDDYCRAVSNTQAYKGLGNGWTAEVIIHILNGALKDVPKDEEIIVLSMYDGIGTGRYCLSKMGFANIKYYAYEIDKYAKQIAMSNYPDIVQMGDAFDLRNENWSLNLPLK